MIKNVSNYQDEAHDDAWETVRTYVDEIVKQWKLDDEVSDDLHNDYADGDSYHHETHVDRAYRLTDAVELLDQLSEYEETDNGLWEGQEPRTAICTQAAFTYGAAVLDYWRILVEELNGYLSDLEVPETEDMDADAANRLRLGEVVIRVFALLGSDRGRVTGDEDRLSAGAWEAIFSGDLTGLLALADWYQENGNDGRARSLRSIVG